MLRHALRLYTRQQTDAALQVSHSAWCVWGGPACTEPVLASPLRSARGGAAWGDLCVAAVTKSPINSHLAESGVAGDGNKPPQPCFCRVARRWEPHSAAYAKRSVPATPHTLLSHRWRRVNADAHRASPVPFAGIYSRSNPASATSQGRAWIWSWVAPHQADRNNGGGGCRAPWNLP